MKNKKATFITIVVLLVIFIPLTIASFYINYQLNPSNDNPNHELFYDGFLWFYNQSDDFIGKYKCNSEVCELTKSTINDEEYGINYYNEGVLTNIPLLDYHFAFITDGDSINLYDVQNEQIITSYKAIKDYHIGLENNNFIIQNNDGLWGVLSVGKNVSNTIPFEYDFIGIINNDVVNNYLSTDKFVVLKETNWYIIDNTNSAISGYIKGPIIDYSSEYIISKDNDRIRLYSYNDSEFFIDYDIKDYTRLDSFIGIVTNDKLYVYTSINSSPIKIIDISDESEKITLQNIEGKTTILAGDKVLDTIEM